MAAREESVLAGRGGPPAHAAGGAAPAWPAAVLALGVGGLLAIHLTAPGFFDNEGRYAEVAREMLLTGDWLSPQMNFTLFLNKPPLTYWLGAAVFSVTGPSEWARLVSVGAAMLTLYATCRLGMLLLGSGAGLVAGLALATTLGFALEARTFRPDMLVVAAVTVSLLCWRRAEEGGTRRLAWLAAMYAALGLGVLAKGIVPVALAAIPIGVWTLAAHGPGGLRRLRPGLGLAILSAVVLPWHVAMALRHPGFAWDYVVHQHLLFLLDRKVPRDSIGDSIGFFWAAFLGRALPWSAVLPLTLGEALRGLAPGAPPGARAAAFAWTWAGGVLGVFSLAPSRLEHYALPALPAVALLTARAWQRARAGALGAPARAWLAAVGTVMAMLGVLGAVRGRAFLDDTYWLVQVPPLLGLVAPAAAVVLAVGVAVAALAVARRPVGAGAVLAAGMVVLVPLVLRAETVAEPLFSWRPVARALAARVPPGVEIVFEAPVEYQQVGGLAFYSGRPIRLLEVPGFVPPAYLANRAGDMFLARDEFARRWRAGEPLALVSDPERRREDPTEVVPPPAHVVGRFGDRWVLAPFPVATR